MTAAKLRVGVVGVGWAGQQHLKGYSLLDGVEIVALAGMETERVAALQDEYGIAQTFARWEEMLETAELDAVSIATPTFLHAPIAIAALRKGLHVLTEKPIAANLADARAMVDEARSAGRVLQVVFNHRLRGDITELGRVIDSGELGTPYIAKAGWLRRAGIPGSSWFAQKEQAGGGPLLDLGVHVIDYVLHLLGEPEVATVSASTYAELGAQALDGFDVEDIAIAFIRLTNGATVTLEASWDAYRAANNEYWMTVYGTEGGAELRVVDYETQQFTVFRTEGGKNADYEVTPSENGGHDKVVREFVETVGRGEAEWPKHDGSLGLKRAEIIDACYRSAESHREVSLV